jgi:hypothetical protein
MIILIVLVVASFVGSVFIFQNIPSRDKRFNEPTISKLECFKRWAALILCLIVFVTSFYAVLTSEKKVIAGAEKVAYVKTNDNAKITDDNTSLIYFDSEANSYFVLECNALNPFNCVYRRELDFDKTEKYVEIYNQLVEANPYPYS